LRGERMVRLLKRDYEKVVSLIKDQKYNNYQLIKKVVNDKLYFATNYLYNTVDNRIEKIDNIDNISQIINSYDMLSVFEKIKLDDFMESYIGEVIDIVCYEEEVLLRGLIGLGKELNSLLFIKDFSNSLVKENKENFISLLVYNSVMFEIYILLYLAFINPNEDKLNLYTEYSILNYKNLFDIMQERRKSAYCSQS